jgi:transposase-like protein
MQKKKHELCRRCGISRHTLRKWLKRYEGNGLSGLKDQIRHLLNISNQKVLKNQEKLILDFRLDRKPEMIFHLFIVHQLDGLLAKIRYKITYTL